MKGMEREPSGHERNTAHHAPQGERPTSDTGDATSATGAAHPPTTSKSHNRPEGNDSWRPQLPSHQDASTNREQTREEGRKGGTQGRHNASLQPSGDAQTSGPPMGRQTAQHRPSTRSKDRGDHAPDDGGLYRHRPEPCLMPDGPARQDGEPHLPASGHQPRRLQLHHQICEGCSTHCAIGPRTCWRTRLASIHGQR